MTPKTVRFKNSKRILVSKLHRNLMELSVTKTKNCLVIDQSVLLFLLHLTVVLSSSTNKNKANRTINILSTIVFSKSIQPVYTYWDKRLYCESARLEMQRPKKCKDLSQIDKKNLYLRVRQIAS